MSDLMSWPDDQVDKTGAWLRALGATDEDLDVAPGDLPGAALDVVLREDATLTGRQLADRTGLSVDELVDLYRELGISVADPDERRFTEVEVELIDLLRSAVVDQFTPQEGHELIVVVARALRSIADASVSAFVQTVEARLIAEGGTLLEWAGTTADAARMGRQLGASLGALFNHFLRQAANHQRAAQREVSNRALMRVAVGFVDLVGFTPLSSTLAPEDLSRLVGEFESQAFDLATEAGARIVKHIGDEIMFTSVDPAAACELALALRDQVEATDTRPRGGMALGDVITRHGDYYGPVVNLASRLTQEAVPGEILVSEAVRDALPEFAFEPAGRRMLKGFDEPVTVLSLT